MQPLVYRVLQDAFMKFNRKMGVAQGIRSLDEQYAIYAQGRALVAGLWKVSDPGKIVTNARPGLSFHNYGIAADCCFVGTDDPFLDHVPDAQARAIWKTYGEIVKSYGMKWGGDFHLINGAVDEPHMEMTCGLSVNDCLELYSHGGIAGVWAYLDKIRGVPTGQGWIGLDGKPLVSTAPAASPGGVHG